MNLDTFFKKFDLFVNASDAMAKMRELVLELAVQGRLTSALPSDGTVPSTIQFREYVATLAKSRGLRLPKESDEELELPFDIPPHWRWMTFNDIGVAQTGTTPSKADHNAFNGDIPFIKPADILPNSINYSNESLTRKGAENGSRLAPGGSLLMVCIGTIGKCNLIERECAFNQQINALTPITAVDSRYLLIAARSRYFQSSAWKKSSSTTIAILNKGKWLSIPVPIPPLSEQKRIVAKVDELMTLCDRLEEQQQERETQHAALARASLSRFAKVPTLANLDFLFHKSYTISPADLRKSILTLAVQGKLVPQDPNDEPAEADFSSLVGIRENSPLKRTKIDNDATVDDPSIPNSWMSVSLGELVSIRTGFAFRSGDYTESGTFILRVTNINPDGSFDTSNAVHLPDNKLDDKMRGFLLDEHELLVVMVGGSLGKIGQVTAEILPALLNQNMWRLKPYSDRLDYRFLRLVLQDLNENRLQITPSTHGHLAMGTYAAAKVPFPPLAEQRRIVAKVEQLMAVVDALETQLAASRTTAANLLFALIAELTAQEGGGDEV